MKFSFNKNTLTAYTYFEMLTIRNRKMDKKIKSAAISAIIIAAIDYAVWVYYPQAGDVVDSLIVGAAVFVLAYWGMKK